MATRETAAEIIEPWHQQMKAREELGDNRRQFSAKPVLVGAVLQVWIARGRTIWIVVAHRGDGKRFVVHAYEKPDTFAFRLLFERLEWSESGNVRPRRVCHCASSR